MKVFICLSLLVVLTAAAVPTCNKIVCGSPTGTDTCASFADKTWTIKACDSGKHCAIKGDNLGDKAPSTTSYKCEDTPKPETAKVVKQLAGEECSSADECFSAKCTNNYCEGVAKDGACVIWATALAAADDSEDKKKACGGNLFCKADKCVAGVDKDGDCTTDPCAWPNQCVSNKCAAPESVDLDGACASDLQCKADHFCKAAKCAKADKDYEAGGSGHPCLKDDDCKPGTCTDICLQFSEDGSGLCGPAGDGYVSKKYVNARRTHIKGQTKYAGLNSGLTGYAAYKPDAPPAPKRGSCYGDFKYAPGGIALYTESSSGFQLVLSMCMFFLYALF